MIKVLIPLEQSEDGFPPIRVEMINASPLGHGLFELENAPFFAANVSYKDVVRASPTARSGQFQFEAVVEPSPFTALSIILMDESIAEFLMELFRGVDCVIEYGEFGVCRVLAVALAKDVDYMQIRDHLQALEDRDLISFAELAIAG